MDYDLAKGLQALLFFGVDGEEECDEGSLSPYNMAGGYSMENACNTRTLYLLLL